MAILKEIEKENGIILNYHRITSLNKITNQNNTIEVNSYINEIQRNKEMEYQEAQRKNANNEELNEKEKALLENGINVFIDAEYIIIPYDESMTIEDAYDYLKTTDKYKDAEDV